MCSSRHSYGQRPIIQSLGWISGVTSVNSSHHQQESSHTDAVQIKQRQILIWHGAIEQVHDLNSIVFVQLEL